MMERSYLFDYLLYTYLLFIVVDGATYNYSTNGADWTGTCSTGTKQSPINIVSSSASVNTSLGTFTFTNYDQANQYGVIKNNGHTIQVDMANTTVKVTGGGLVQDDYILAQFHIHFASSSTEGSEHTVDGTQYPLEIHFVHYANTHGNLATAAGQTDGLAVLGFFFEIQSADNAALSFMIDLIANVSNKDDSVSLSGASINSFLTGIDLTKFFRYSGSLTTPTCDEVVQWTVFRDKIKISESQMNKIRATYQDNGVTLIGKNYRAVQSLNGRSVQVSYNSSSNVLPSCSSLTLAALFCLAFALVSSK